MTINHDEIIEEIDRHIRKFGGERSAWCVGTAKDARGPFFRRHLTADLGDELIYREAFTTTAADEALDHLVNACGLRLAPEAERGSAAYQAEGSSAAYQAGGGSAALEAERGSAAHQAEGSSALHDALEPGKIVFVYRPARDSGLGVRDSRLTIRATGDGERDSKEVRATPPASQRNQPASAKLAA